MKTVTKSDFRTKLDNYGWTLRVYEIESASPPEWSSDDNDDDSNDNDEECDDACEVDDDDDSDFWRRPADLRAEAKGRRWVRKQS